VDGASQAFAADPSDATWAEVRRAAREEHDGLTRAYADLGAAAPELAGDVQTAGDATLQLLELYEGFSGPFTAEGLQAAVQQAFSAQYLIEVQASGRRVQDSVRSSCEIDLAGS
jgi:hypothetical protein